MWDLCRKYIYRGAKNAARAVSKVRHLAWRVPRRAWPFIEGECDVEVEDWIRLDGEQDDLDDEEKICPQSFYDCEVGTVLALEDRNSLAQDWPGRRVFVVRGNTSACVFDCNFRQDHR